MEQSRENEFITIMPRSRTAKAVNQDVEQLHQRLTENINGFKSNWLLDAPEKLIEDATLIADVIHVYNHMIERQYTEQEVSYLLKFQNPLDVVSDHWAYCEILPDALDAMIAEIVDRQDDLSLFPLITDERRPNDLERVQEQPDKPSIKNQLAVKPVPGNKLAAKNKDREVR